MFLASVYNNCEHSESKGAKTACGNCVFGHVSCLSSLVSVCIANCVVGLFYLMLYYTSLSIDVIAYRQIMGSLTRNELHMIWKKGTLSSIMYDPCIYVRYDNRLTFRPHLNPETLEGLSTCLDFLCSGFEWPPCHNEFHENRSGRSDV